MRSPPSTAAFHSFRRYLPIEPVRFANKVHHRIFIFTPGMKPAVPCTPYAVRHTHLFQIQARCYNNWKRTINPSALPSIKAISTHSTHSTRPTQIRICLNQHCSHLAERLRAVLETRLSCKSKRKESIPKQFVCQRHRADQTIKAPSQHVAHKLHISIF